jgi:hypothetical protein
LPPEQAAPADQLVQDRYLDRRLRAAVDTELRAKGFTPVALTITISSRPVG